MLANVLSDSFASRDAMRMSEVPMGYLTHPATRLASQRMRRAMSTFATAGNLYGSQELSDGEDFKLSSVLRTTFLEGASTIASAQDACIEGCHPLPTWVTDVVGRDHTHPVCSGAAFTSIQNPRGWGSSIGATADVLHAAFRSKFAPLWMLGMTKGVRAQRLDLAQYKAIQPLNSALRLCQSIPDPIAIRMYESAFANVQSAIMTPDEVFETLSKDGLLDNEDRLVPTVHHERRGDKISDHVASMGPKRTAALLTFCKAAWLQDQIIVVDLGERSRRLQTISILARAGDGLPDALAKLPTIELTERLSNIPTHCHNLCFCVECKRITNASPPSSAHSTNGGDEIDGSFSEVGASCVMTTCSHGGERSLYCAKRSSAALRSAVASDQSAARHQIDQMDTTPNTCTTMLERTSHDHTAASRMRRDCRRALEQRCGTFACGTTSVVKIPLVGRAVRLFGSWHVICTFCGCFTRASPSNRLEGEVWCGCCCHESIVKSRSGIDSIWGRISSAGRGDDIDTLMKQRRVCRYCNKAEISAPQQFYAYMSPHDKHGSNKVLPPEMRITWWCAQHNKSWLADALAVHPTNVILSHIVEHARPMVNITAENSDFKNLRARAIDTDRRFKRLVNGKRK